MRFQFLWGWNLVNIPKQYLHKYSAFNSFEDETGRVGGKANRSHAPFNSFEDETGTYPPPLWKTANTFNSFEDETRGGDDDVF